MPAAAQQQQTGEAGHGRGAWFRQQREPHGSILVGHPVRTAVEAQFREDFEEAVYAIEAAADVGDGGPPQGGPGGTLPDHVGAEERGTAQIHGKHFGVKSAGGVSNLAEGDNGPVTDRLRSDIVEAAGPGNEDIAHGIRVGTIAGQFVHAPLGSTGNRGEAAELKGIEGDRIAPKIEERRSGPGEVKADGSRRGHAGRGAGIGGDDVGAGGGGREGDDGGAGESKEGWFHVQ